LTVTHWKQVCLITQFGSFGCGFTAETVAKLVRPVDAVISWSLCVGWWAWQSRANVIVVISERCCVDRETQWERWWIYIDITLRV